MVMSGFAGIQYTTAQGDPHGLSRARMSVIGAEAGLPVWSGTGLPVSSEATGYNVSIEPARCWLMSK